MRVTRLALVAPWAASALALALSAPSLDAAPRHPRSTARCIHYRQKLDKEQTGVELSLDNKCSFDVGCTLRWDVRCAGDKDVQHGGAAFDLPAGQSDSTFASAAACRGDWEVANVVWSCSETKPPPPADQP